MLLPFRSQASGAIRIPRMDRIWQIPYVPPSTRRKEPESASPARTFRGDSTNPI
jgi:hypothetical protein